MAFTMARPAASVSRMNASTRPQRSMVVSRALTAEKASLDIAKMEPIHDRVLIKPMEEEQKTAGGILLPKSGPKAPSDAHFGEVISVGPEVKLALAPGDKVVFQKYAMAEVELKEGAILFVAEKSILAKLD